MSRANQYRKVAKKLGVRYLFGRWGLQVGRNIFGKYRVSIVALDGWILDPDKVAEEMRRRGYEL